MVTQLYCFGSDGNWHSAGRAAVSSLISLPTRGALAVGSATYTIPGGAKYVATTGSDTTGDGSVGNPWATVGHAIAALISTGGTVVVRAGTYHESINTAVGTVGVGITVQNYPGEAVWFDGSQIVSTWSSGGGVWTHTGVPTQFSRANSGAGSLPSSYLGSDPYAAYGDQVFLDGVPLTQIADGVTPAAGQFSVNYGANTITIGSDPTGHEVRVSDLRHLCVASAPVSWKGVGVRYYAPDNTSSVGAPFYYGGNSAGSVFENVHVRYSGLAAMNLNKPDITVQNCTIYGSMYSGIGGDFCDRIAIKSSIIQNNNRGNFLVAPATGGIKVTRCFDPYIWNNLVDSNNGAHGIWTDVTVLNALILHNSVTGNHNAGVQNEEGSGDFIGGVRKRSIVAGNFINGARFGFQVFVQAYTDYYNNTVTNSVVEDVITQTDRPATGNSQEGTVPGVDSGTTSSRCPYMTYSQNWVNNKFDSASALPFRAIDSTSSGFSADEMQIALQSNLFTKGSGALVQWGTHGSVAPFYTSYSSLATLQAAEPTNTSGNVQGSSMLDTAAVPLPANVATALGVAAGVKRVGAYLTS